MIYWRPFSRRSGSRQPMPRIRVNRRIASCHHTPPPKEPDAITDSAGPSFRETRPLALRPHAGMASRCWVGTMGAEGVQRMFTARTAAAFEGSCRTQ